MSFDKRLIAVDGREFESFLISAKNLRNLLNGEAPIKEMLLALAEFPSISDIESNRRLTLVLSHVKPDYDLLLSAYLGLSGRGKRLFHSIASYLPAEMRPRLVPKTSDSAVKEVASGKGLAGLTPDLESVTPVATSGASPITGGSSDSIVLLVGDSNELESSKSLLKGNRIGFEEHETIQKAITSSNPIEVCAIVVANSCCIGIPAHEQLAVLRSIVRLSSQAWVKIGSTALAPEHRDDLADFRRKLGYSTSRAENIALDATAELTGTDLGFIRPAARFFDLARKTILLVDDITELQALLIALAMNKELQAVGYQGEYIGHFSARVTGGRSGAKILIIRAEGFKGPVVLRLHSRAAILDENYGEFGKIQRLVVPWNKDLSPSIYYIGDEAALVYKSIRDSGASTSLAITLGDRLSVLQKGELPDPPIGLPRRDELASAVCEALELLGSLNKTRPPDSVTGFGYEYVREHLSKMAADGREVFVSNNGVPLRLLELLEAALKLVGPYATVAVNHGDPHVSNILLPTDAHGELIDFERATAGHPLYDICHLLLSLSCSAFRYYDLSHDVVNFFQQALFGESDKVCSSAEKSEINTLIWDASRKAKQVSAELCSEYGMGSEQFPAMLIVVASMVILYLPHLNSEVSKCITVAAYSRIAQ